MVSIVPVLPVQLLTAPNRLSTRSTYARGASHANHSPSSFDAEYVLCGDGFAVSSHGSEVLPSKTKSVL